MSAAVVEICSVELLALIADQRRDDEFGHMHVRDAPLEILAGLNPGSLKHSRPRYFLSGRLVHRRPLRRKGAVVTCGTATMYKRGCRCDDCKLAQSLRRKAQRAASKIGVSS